MAANYWWLGAKMSMPQKWGFVLIKVVTVNIYSVLLKTFSFKGSKLKFNFQKLLTFLHANFSISWIQIYFKRRSKI